MKTIAMMVSVFALTTVLSASAAYSQEAKEMWPGVKVKVLLDNEHVKVAEVTFEPGAVADWHEHPDHIVYAITDLKMKEELKGSEDAPTVEMKAGEAKFLTARSHKVTNTGKKAFTALSTELKKQ